MSGNNEFNFSKPFALIAAMLAAAAMACSDSTGVNAVASVAVTPATKLLAVGDEATLAARALDASGKVVQGRSTAWSSSNAAIATVTTSGLVRAIGPGNVSIQATIDGKVGAAQLTVELAPVARVEVNPANVSLSEGESRTLIARAFDVSGRPLDGRAVVWMSRDPTVAEVDASGRIVAKRVGSIVVTATVEGHAAEVTVTVTRVAVASIAVTPTALILSVGQTRQLTAIVLDAAGNRLADRVVIWTTDSPAVARVSGTGLVWGTGPGYATITATSEGKSFSLAVTGENGDLDIMPYDLIYHRWSQAALGEIMVLGTTAGSQPIKLNAGNVSREPTPSPNGNRIAFAVSQVDPIGLRIDDIFAVDRNGMNVKRLTTEAGADDQPAWSPLGDRIAYRHIDAVSGRTDIWLMNADGSQKMNLTSELPDKQSIGEPAWSPDGARIAFALSSSIGVAGTSSGIWTMKVDGSAKRVVASVPKLGDRSPTWSADGTRIAFVRAYDEDTDITIANVVSGAITRIQLLGQQEGPSWSPDGQHIAFWQAVDFLGNTSIFTMRTNGTNLRLHTLEPEWGRAYDPSWIRRQ